MNALRFNQAATRGKWDRGRKQDVYLLSYTRKNSIWIKELNIFKNETKTR